MARLIREEHPEIPIVLGGVHASIAPEACLEACDAFDVVVRGEAEKTSSRLFSALLNSGHKDLASIRGLVFRKNGTLINTGDPEPVEDLDSLPFPARHLLVDLDKMPPHAFQSLYGFRGCPFKCIFCGSFNVFGRKPRMRSAQSMADEIEMVYKTYGTRYFYLCDDIFMLRRERAIEFCSIMEKKRLPVYYSVQARGEMLDPELLRWLKRTGCQHIAIGVEVGDEEIRKLIRKGNTVDQMRKAARLIREAGLRMVGFFMFGFPWETREHMLKTLHLMEELRPCIAFPYIVTPSPGTELLEIAQHMGLVGGQMDYASFHHESPKMGLTAKIPEAERKELIDFILERFTVHNKESLQWDLFRRPRFYWAAASDAGITSSFRVSLKYLTKTFNRSERGV
jgi:radical SAM superfamily enzyme YgiQ (UPF0313 family)